MELRAVLERHRWMKWFAAKDARHTPFTRQWPSFMVVVAISMAIVIARRPDALYNAQFWAEDGRNFYANAYNLGPLHSLFLPYSGSFQEIQRVTSSIAVLLPLRLGPLFLNLCAIAIQILPIALLWSPRFQRLVPNTSARALISFLYLALPNTGEIDASITNSAWHLSLVALMILILTDSKTRMWRWFDRTVLVMVGLSGPFVFFLAILASIDWWRSRDKVRLERFSLLALLALVQLAVLAASAGSRRHSPLGSSLHLLVQIMAGQIFLTPLVGQEYARKLVQAPHYTVIIASTGIAILGYAFWQCTRPLRLLLSFAGLALSAALVSPLTSGPEGAWHILSRVGSGGRYFFLPMIAWMVCLVWLASSHRVLPRFIGIILLFTACAVGIPRDWIYQPYADLGYGSQVKAFNQSPNGTVRSFPINPGWTMVLRKQ